MYCFITTVSVAFYWARSDETLHYKSDETVNFCCFRCATASPISVFYKLRLIHLYFLLLFFVGFDVSDFYKVTSTSLIFYLLAPKGCELVATKTMNPSTYREFALEFGNTSEFFVICIRYNTVWSELCECNEQTHSRQCCNLLISWHVNAGRVYGIHCCGWLGGVGLSWSKYSVDPRCSSNVRCRHVVVVSVGLEWMWQILFGLFVIYRSEEIGARKWVMK